MKRFWFLLFSLFSGSLLSGAAFADATVNSQTKVHSFLTPDMLTNDVSLSILGQIFGTVGNVIHGSSGQFVGQLFYKLNQGFCVVAGLWLFYTIASTIFKASQEGSLMGQNRNTFWIFLRISIGMGLLLPMPLTGYSVFQGTVMSVVTQGVGLADQTWSWVLDSLKNGNKIYTDPTKNQILDPTNGKTSDDFSSVIKQIQNVAAGETCYYLEQPVVDGDASLAALAGGSSKIWTEDNKGNYLFAKNSAPGDCGTVNWSTSLTADQVAKVLDPAQNNYDEVAQQAADLADSQMSQVDIDNFGNSDDQANQAKLQEARAMLRGITLRQATLQVITDLQPAIKQLVVASKSKTGITNLQRIMVGAAVANAVTDYTNLTQPMRRLLNQDSKNQALDFVKQAKKEGWLMAGRYYWDLVDSGINTPNAGSIKSVLFNATPASSSEKNPSLMTEVQGTVDGQQCSANTIACAINNALFSLYDNQNHGQGSDNVGGFGDRSSKGSLIETIILGAFLPFLGGLISLLSSFQDVGADPIIFLHNIGTGCISTMISIWLMGAMYSVMVAIPAMVCTSVQPIGWAIQALGDWIRPIAFGTTGLLIIAGIILGYYAPLYPWMVFTFATLGWIISVIEAMVAAPLVSLGLTHPEGHDFLGKVEQALMLLLGVFLRPVLMIMGLLISMILCYVILRVVNYGFVGIIQSAFPTPTKDIGLYGAVNNVAFTQAAANVIKSGALGGAFNPLNIFGGIINLIGQALIFPLVVIGCLLVLYAGLVFNLINQIFTLIYVLPDKIMRWVGTPQEHSDVASGVQQTRGTMGSSTGFIHGGQGERSADAIGRAAEKKKADEDKNAQSDLSGGGYEGDTAADVGTVGKAPGDGGNAKKDGSADGSGAGVGAGGTGINNMRSPTDPPLGAGMEPTGT